MEPAHFRAEKGASISLEKWGSRVEEPSKFHLQEYLCIKKRFLRKRTRIDLFVFSIQEKGTDRTLPPCSRKRRTDRIQEDVCPTGFSCFLMNQEYSYRPDSVCVQKQFCPTSLTLPDNGASAFSGRKRCQHSPRKMGFPSGGALKISPAGILRVSKNVP